MYEDIGYGEDTLTELFHKVVQTFERFIPIIADTPDYFEQYKAFMTDDLQQKNEEAKDRLKKATAQKVPGEPHSDEHKDAFIQMVENVLTISDMFMDVSDAVEPWTRSEETSAELTNRNYPTLAKLYRP